MHIKPLQLINVKCGSRISRISVYGVHQQPQDKDRKQYQ